MRYSVGLIFVSLFPVYFIYCLGINGFADLALYPMTTMVVVGNSFTCALFSFQVKMPLNVGCGLRKYC